MEKLLLLFSPMTKLFANSIRVLELNPNLYGLLLEPINIKGKIQQLNFTYILKIIYVKDITYILKVVFFGGRSQDSKLSLLSFGFELHAIFWISLLASS